MNIDYISKLADADAANGNARTMMAGKYAQKAVRAISAHDWPGATDYAIKACSRSTNYAPLLTLIDAAKRGATTSPARAAASRANGAKGGRPQTDLSRAVDETISILDKVYPDRAAWMGQFRAVTRHGLTVADRAARLADILASLGWQDDPRFGALYDAINREPEE